MIEPQTHKSQPGAIGQQHGLTRLTTALESLEAGQYAQQQRDGAMQAQLATQAEQLALMAAWGKRLLIAIGLLVGLTLGLAGLVAWQFTHPPELGYVRALAALDAALGQQWSTLPKGTQEALSATYGRLGLVPPGQRK